MKIILFILLNISFTKKASEAEVTHRVALKVSIGDKELEEEIVLGLFGNDTPKTVENFYTICTDGVDH